MLSPVPDVLPHVAAVPVSGQAATGRSSCDIPPPDAVETPDVSGAYPRLHDEELEALRHVGRRQHLDPGDVLFREGDLTCDFLAILDGLVAVVEGTGDDERVLAVHGPRRFLGELSLLTNQALFTSAVARTEGEVLVVPIDRLRELVATDPGLGDLIMRAYLIRRSILIGLGTGFKIVGSHHSADTRRLREFATRNRLPHRWIDLEHDAHAEALLQRLGIAPQDLPVVFWRGELMRNPTNAELARTIGLRSPHTSVARCDLLVVGGGPAGLAAAVYGASEGLTTITLDGVATGGQAGTSPRIENYLGFPAGISGAALAERAEVQAQRFGARFMVPAQATAIDRVDAHYRVRLEDGGEVTGRTVLIATGARYRRLEAKGIDEFESTSIFYAATPVEAGLCGSDDVVVVGGGNSAGQASLFLARTGARVRLLVRARELGARMSRYLADRIERAPGLDVLLHTEVHELRGEDDELESIVVEDNHSGDRSEVPARALFVFIGAEPHAAWLSDLVALDDRGFVLTGSDAARSPCTDAGRDGSWRPGPLETTACGVFAVGDVRSGSVKRVSAAVGEGSMVVRLISDHLDQRWGGVGR
ncbi:MAG: cyclic nucleotide-binding protein [Acidimicrobiales bacterium]|nr:cyclic nucleotide-binding protein [Acidimicrobiales bacterium]